MRRRGARLSLLIPAFFTATAAEAYIGPGAGLSVIGSVLALLGALLLMIVGFVWYPVKRLMKRRKAAASASPSKEAGQKPAKGPKPEQDRQADEPVSPS